MSNVQAEYARGQAVTAMRYYNDCYDNRVYERATAGKSIEYANALIDEAMAICGHPHFKLSWRHWAPEALEYLWLFKRD